MSDSRRGLFALIVAVLLASGAHAWWQGREQVRLAALIASSSAEGDIEMLSSETCVFCARAREWFGANKVVYKECTIERDKRCEERYAQMGSPGMPVLIVRGQVQVGFSPEMIAKGLGARRG